MWTGDVLVQVVKKSGAVNSSNAVGNMSPLSRNISALLELPLEDQGIPHIIPESSGNIYGTSSPGVVRHIYGNVSTFNTR